jgi:hypothetical protein
MSPTLHDFLDHCRRFIAQHRWPLRLLVLLAILATLADGLWMPRDVVHLLVGHTLLLLALGTALVIVEETDADDEPGSHDGRNAV